MAEVPWIVRFVDKPDIDRTIRLDLNDEEAGGKVYVRPDGFTLGVAEKEVVTTGSMLSDGEPVTAFRRTNREPVIPLAVVGESTDLAEVLNALARELDRERTYLEFKPSDHTGESVFFTVLPGSDFSEVDLDPDDYPQEKGVQVTLLAEPVGVGLEVSGSGNTAQDPGGSPNPMLALPPIKGDVPTPLTVKVGTINTDSSGPMMVSVCAGPPTLAAPLMVQAEALTTGTGVTPGTDPTMSGTGGPYDRIGFGTNDLTTLRLSGDVPSVPPGKYRVWARLRNTVANDMFDLRLDTGAASSGLTGDVRTFDPPGAANGIYWFDLGVVDHPYYQPDDVTAAENLTLRLYAMRTAGTGSLDADAFMLVPLDLRGNNPGRVALATPSSSLGSGNRWVFRPDQGMVYGSVPTKPAPVVGSHDFRAVPGENTYIHMMRRTYPGTTALTPTTTVEWSYRPQWLYLSGPA